MALLGAVVGLLIAMLRVSKVRFDYERLPEGDAKRTFLRAIERAGRVLPLNAALRIARLSPSRYHSWCRSEAGCDLDDQLSCPIVVELSEVRAKTREERMQANRGAVCDVCSSGASSPALQLQRPRFRM